MIFLKKLLITCALFFVANASANSPFSPFVIKAQVIHDWGTHIFVQSASDVSNSEGCGGNTSLTLDKQHPFFREMYAALLLAYQTSNPISGWMNGCSPFNVPNLTRLDMAKDVLHNPRASLLPRELNS